MGIFDKLSETVTGVVRQATDSTKTFADKNRIRRDLGAMENELRNRFRDIGEKYYQETRETPAPEYKELFDAIVELQASLAAKQRELEELDGTVACPNCGRHIARDSHFCPNCGAQAPVPTPMPQPMQSVCPICGAALSPDAVFCAACGNKVTPPAPAAPFDGISPVPSVDLTKDAPGFPQNPVPPAAPSPAFCPSCGTELSPDAVFCPTCGTKAPGLD